MHRQTHCYEKAVWLVIEGMIGIPGLRQMNTASINVSVAQSRSHRNTTHTRESQIGLLCTSALQFPYICLVIALTSSIMSNLPCDYQSCPATFSSKAGLHRHIRNIHEMIMDTPCPYCPKMCRDKFNLNIHLRRHIKAAPVESFPPMQETPAESADPVHDLCCDMCGLSVGRKDFCLHMKWHAEELRREISGLSESLAGFFKCFATAQATFQTSQSSNNS